ncbi:MAG: chemotaxis protein CheW [Candidatus Nitrosotenuis sp.]|uniref:Chemotaxis protein CheW n=1 Tax=Candidatus Nitrosotenuis uzonensis TaxID=1407055 RepID=A0A812F5M5_9ARCH|nr:chemotaxis protein CheW [Candidatus Nitrosotenuis uzonensis]CAE6491908.1 Chemotaxis protein CheW [Candidatus Nitrosotenuis uzonensis]
MSVQETALDSFQVVTFSLTDGQKKEEYAIPIEQVREIRAVESITQIPNSKSYVKGIMNLRGLIVPVIDVKDKLGMKSNAESNAKQRILVADLRNSLAGLLVDEVDHVMRIQTDSVDDPPQNILDSNNYIKGIVKVSQRLIVLLDVTKLLEDSTSDITEAMKGAKQ